MVGDEFVKNTFASNVIKGQTQYFMTETYNSKEFSSNRFEDGNIFSRIHNCLVRAINRYVIFPQMIVIVLDSDVTKNFDVEQDTCEEIVKTGVEKIMKMIHELITNHQRLLPMRSRRFKYPTVLWIIPPVHTNFSDNENGVMLGNYLEKAVMRFNEMRFARMKIWDADDISLVTPSNRSYRFTAKGLLYYWVAVDAALRHWYKTQSSKNNSNNTNWKGKAGKYFKKL